ncbi:MAG: DMT family transporter, partial [Candidatus Eremiobacteraeota bacterium]|nr:DMT family transporter [Candidatus Eremiobacteraeota bacterium]
WQTIVGTIPLVIAALLIPEPRVVWSLPLIGTLAYATILAGIVAWAVWLKLLEKISASTAGMGTLAIPVVGIVSAYLQLGERPQPIQWLGIVTILAALVLVTTANVPRLRLAFARLRSG